MLKTLQVIDFEVSRSLKKLSFWLAALLVPMILAIYIIICAFVGYSAGSSLDAGSSVADLQLAYVDDADYLTNDTFINERNEDQSLKRYESLSSAMSDLQQQKIDVIYYIPEDFRFSDDPSVEIYTKLDKNSILDNYQAPINALLTRSAELRVRSIDSKILTNKITFNTTSFATDDHVVEKKELITNLVAPVTAIVLFYILMAVLGNRLSVSMTEEKENRISELLLVSIKPINLIVGKIVSLMILGIIQLIVLLIPAVIVYLVALRNNLVPEDFIVNPDPKSIALHALLLIASYFLFTAINVFTGTLVSTAKEASSFAGIIVVVMIIPFMMLNVFTDGANSNLSYFLSYFPLSAPLALMLRSIFGNLQEWELLLGIADIALFASIMTIWSSRIFCKNAVGFNFNLSFKNFGKTRKKW